MHVKMQAKAPSETSKSAFKVTYCVKADEETYKLQFCAGFLSLCHFFGN